MIIISIWFFPIGFSKSVELDESDYRTDDWRDQKTSRAVGQPDEKQVHYNLN